MSGSQSAGSESANRPWYRSSGTPALLTRMSTGPSDDSTDAIPARTASRSPTSNAIPTDRPPAAAIGSATASARSPCRSLTATAAPCSASTSAIPRPTPRPAPVTSATRPNSAMSARLLEAEAELERDLVMRDRAVLDVPADSADLEPVEIAQCLCGLRDGAEEDRCAPPLLAQGEARRVLKVRSERVERHVDGTAHVATCSSGSVTVP